MKILHVGKHIEVSEDAGTIRKTALDDVGVDLLVNEQMMLTIIRDATDHKAFFPNIISVEDNPRTLVFEKLDGFYSLHQLWGMFPDGVDPKDMAWIYRRVLYAMVLAAEVGVKHRYIRLNNIIVHPTEHGVVLLNWEHATLDSYFGSDVAAAKQRMIDLLRGKHLSITQNLPSVIRSHLFATEIMDLDGLKNEAARFDECLQRAWGGRKYHPMIIPTTP